MAKFVRFGGRGAARYGRIVNPGEIEALTGPAWEGGQPTGEYFPLASVRLLAPCEPSKVVLVAHNFPGHARERKRKLPENPLLFLKPPSAIIGPDSAIVRPRSSSLVQHEAELGIVIGRRCHRVTKAYARGFCAGLTCVNDVTAQDIQDQDHGFFLRAKGFDTFCPIGPWIEEQPLDIAATTIRCTVNGDVRQSGRGEEILF